MDALDESVLLEHIGGLENQKARLLQDISDIDHEISMARARHGKLRNQKAAISRLPNEIFITIFQMCLKRWPPKKPAFELVASRVSSRWREVVLGTPFFWNSISISIDPSKSRMDNRLQLLVARLMRSKPLLLDITIVDRGSTFLNPVLEEIIRHSSRWQSLSLSSDTRDPKVIFWIERNLGPVIAPCLQRLSIRVGRSPSILPNSPPTPLNYDLPRIMTNGAPSLSFVRVTGWALGRLEPPLRLVNTLHLEGCERFSVSYRQLQAAMVTLPLLTNLSLRSIAISLLQDPLETTDPAIIPSLRSLRIYGTEIPSDSILSRLSFPQLESLFLHDLTAFNSLTIPSLRSLTLDRCEFTSTDIFNIILAFPNLCSVSIDEYYPTIYTVLLLPPADTFGWSNLRIISLQDMAPIDTAH
ncbi:hypothetical protein BD779DRAFT_1668353 [Infundibulicybe gibba]|nr:hypothetical protein BD779DRAFT_1668353 [Infundibulicybe gibba]